MIGIIIGQKGVKVWNSDFKNITPINFDSLSGIKMLIVHLIIYLENL